MTLKLMATDADDLKIVSSALQDAILRAGDIHYDSQKRAVSLRLSRYRHESGGSERIECGVRVDGVMGLQSQNIDQNNADSFLVLLKAEFAPADKPAGQLDLTFAGGGALRLSVESLDLILADVGEARVTKRRPSHDETA